MNRINSVISISLLCVLFISGACTASEETVTILDKCDYRFSRSARSKWTPLRKPIPRVEMKKVNGVRMMRLSCNFSKNDDWRVAWDRQGTWDLSACQEVALDAAEASGKGAKMILHLRSGSGWYGVSFFVPSGLGAIRLKRKQFEAEESPDGWHTINGIRLSVVRDSAVDRSVYVSNLRAIARPVDVAVYQNDAGTAKEGGIPQFAKLVADALDRLQISYELMDDRAVAGGRLKGKRIAILPLNPVLPEKSAWAVREFVGRGGKLIACYCLPKPLDSILGLKLGGAIHAEDGSLKTIRFHDNPQRPEIDAVQHSWMARELIPNKTTRVVGRWVNREGAVTMRSAVTRNENGYFVGHVLTREDLSAKDRLLMEMIGELYPAQWKTVYRRRLSRLGHMAGRKGVQPLSALIAKNVGSNETLKKGTTKLLAYAAQLTESARVAMAAGKAVTAAEKIGRAHNTYARALALSLPSRPHELRGVWCHSPTGIRGWTWEKSLQRLSESGFNAIFPNMCWGGGAAYESEWLPMVSAAHKHGDQLAACLAAAGKYGVDVHVWRVNWNLWHNVPAGFKQRLRKSGRLQRDADGNILDWLCPSHHENRTLEVGAMVEMVEKYDVAGIHFDYIRYPGLRACFCSHCKARFELEHNLKVADWPNDVRHGKLKSQYLDFRRQNITWLVARVSRETRKIKPDILISAAVFWDWPGTRDDVAQDWPLWIKKGYVDFVCPMQYTTRTVVFEHQLRATKEWAGKKGCVVPGIGATLGLSPEGTLEQVLIARRQRAPGFLLFEYNAFLANEHLPLLQLGATSKKTRPPFGKRQTIGSRP